MRRKAFEGSVRFINMILIFLWDNAHETYVPEVSDCRERRLDGWKMV